MAITKVTTDVITALAVTAPKLAANAVTTDKLADNAVTAAKIAAGALGDQVAGITSSASATTIAGTLTSTGTITGTLATAAQTNITSLGTLTALTVDDITINGSTISDGADLTLDAEGDITLDANGGQIYHKDAGTTIGYFENSSSDWVLRASVQDKDIKFMGNDNGSGITALTLDMSEAGSAYFNNKVAIGHTSAVSSSTLTLNGNQSALALSRNTGTDVTWTLSSDAENMYLSDDGNSSYNMMWKNNGNVSIGSIGCKATLDIKTTGNDWEDGLLLQHDNANTGWNIHPERADNALYFGYNSDTSQTLANQTATARMVIEGAGNVGIGTTSPDVLLHLKSTSAHIAQKIETTVSTGNATLALLAHSVGDSVLYFGDNTDADVGSIFYDHSSNYMAFTVNTDEAMRIDSSGFVGINTAGAASYTPLTLETASGSAYAAGGVNGVGLMLRNRSSTVGTSSGIKWAANSSYHDLGGIHMVLTGNSNTNETADMTFFTSNSGDSGNTEKMRIGSGGEVGIGTNNPQRLLHLYANSSGDTAVMRIQDNGSHVAGIELYSGHGNWGIYNSDTVGDALEFRDDSAGVTRMIIKNTGYVGIGTTSPAGLLHVDGHTSSVASIFESNGNGDTVPVQLKVKANNGTTSTQGLYGNAGSTQADNTITLGYSGTNGLSVDSAGKVGIGTIDPQVKFHIVSTANTGDAIMRFQRYESDQILNNDDVVGETEYWANDGSVASDATTKIGSIACVIQSTALQTQLRFKTYNTSLAEHMRLYGDGTLVIGNCATPPNGSTSNQSFLVNGQSTSSRAATNLQTHKSFMNPNGTVGTIKTTGSATQFNTSSDYRLKENVVTDWDGTTLLKQLKPSKFNFKADADTTIQGFLAHEVSSIVPQAISGTKDSVYTEEEALDGEGVEGQPNYQGIDHSHLVPLLVKTVQELEARIKTLEG